MMWLQPSEVGQAGVSNGGRLGGDRPLALVECGGGREVAHSTKDTALHNTW